MKDKTDLNKLRQTKEYIPKRKTVDEKCKAQTDKVKEKIEEIVATSHQKLNQGTSSEKMMAVGVIQLVNEIQLLTKECPNYSELGKNIKKLFGINKKFN